MGKWSQGAYERSCADKMKTLFYKMNGHKVYNAEVERKYRNFIETLDTDDVHVVRQFRRLVDAQDQANADKERTKEAAHNSREFFARARRENQRLGRSTTIQADIDPDEQARASTFQLTPADLARLQHPYDEGDEQSTQAGDDQLEQGPRDGPTHLRDANSRQSILPAIPDRYAALRPTSPHWDYYPSILEAAVEDAGRYEGYTDYYGYDQPLDFEEGLSSWNPRFGRPQSASPLSPTIPRTIPRPRSHSPPWSLSHERQRASTVGARPFPAQMRNITASASYGPMYEPTPRENALSEAILGGQQAIDDSVDNAPWIQAARDEIHEENASANLAMNRGPAHPATRHSATFNPSTSSGPLGRPLRRTFTLNASAPTTDEDEPPVMRPIIERPNRRRRIQDPNGLSTDSEGDGETTAARDVRRRLTNGDPYRPVDGPLPTGSLPEVPSVFRMQRPRRSMPPLSAGMNRSMAPSPFTFTTFPIPIPNPNEEQRQRERARERERDTRRDGVVWDVEDVDDSDNVFDHIYYQHQDDQDQGPL